MTNTILHFIPDEKVTDQIIDNFDSVINNNTFIIFKAENDKLKYSKIVKQNIIIYDQKQNIYEIITSLNPKAIILHGLYNIFIKILLELKPCVKIAWFVWGFDIYNLPKINSTLYAPKTNSFLLKKNKKLYIRKFIDKNDLLRKLFCKYVLKKEDYISSYFRVIDRIDYFCSYIVEEFLLFSKYNNHKLIFFHTPYFSIKQYLAGNEILSLNDSAHNILLGNSNSIENNHLDAMHVLKIHKEDMSNSKIFVPLSYGNDEKYKQEILRYGNKHFGHLFMPLTTFLDRKEYLCILQSCSVGIFYHYRQQAMGNIIALLYMGARVYLSSHNSVFVYLKRIGIHVFDFDKEFYVYKTSQLSKQDITTNRRILDDIFSEEKVKENLCKLSLTLTNT